MLLPNQHESSDGGARGCVVVAAAPSPVAVHGYHAERRVALSAEADEFARTNLGRVVWARVATVRTASGRVGEFDAVVFKAFVGDQPLLRLGSHRLFALAEVCGRSGTKRRVRRFLLIRLEVPGALVGTVVRPVLGCWLVAAAAGVVVERWNDTLLN